MTSSDYWQKKHDLLLEMARERIERAEQAESQLALAMVWGAALARTFSEAMVELAEVASMMPRPREPQAKTLPWLSVPAHAIDAVEWAVEVVVHIMRRELESHPPERQNRLSVSVLLGKEIWTLTLARGDYEHRVEERGARWMREAARDVADEAREAVDALDPATVCAAARAEEGP